MRNRLKFSSKGGFTLIELVVVIAIMAILSSIGTAGYSAYVKRANRAADESMIHSIEDALILGAYSKNYAPGSVVGAVGVSKGGPATDSPDDHDGNGTGDVNEMMISVFGENWKDTLQLKSDYFSESDSSKMMAAIQAAKEKGSTMFNSVPESSFYKKDGNTSALVEDVDEIASALNGVLNGMGDTAFTMFWGDAFHNSVNDAGLAEDWKNDDQMAANLTVFAAANQIAGSDDTVKDAWIQSWESNGDVKISSNHKGYVADLVMNYAKCVALYNYVQNDPNSRYNNNDKIGVSDAYQALTEAMAGLRTPSDAGYVGDFQNALNAFNASTSEYYADWQTAPEGGQSQAEKDAEAFLASMTAINSMEGNYVNKDQKELLGSENAFSAAGAANVLDTMVNYAKMSELPAGEYIIVLSIAADGKPVITPTLQEEQS